WVDRVLLMDEGKIVVDAPPRRAFDDIKLWQSLGVSVPQVVQLARALPDVFHDTTPLSVDEAYTVLTGTDYARRLLQSNEAIGAAEAFAGADSARRPRLIAGTADSSAPLLSWESI